MGSIRGGMIEALLTTLSAASVLLGIALIYLGRRGRRIDDHPLCRKCGYDLTGRPEGSGRCAECGADLSRRRAVRVGNRAPRRPLFWAGVSIITLLLMLTGGIIWVRMSSTDLMKYKPVWLLRRDASSMLSNKRMPAVTELTRRISAGELSDAQIQAIISNAIVFQANPNFPWSGWDDLLSTIASAGKLGNVEWVALARQSVKLSLRARPSIIAGDSLPVTLTAETNRPPWSGTAPLQRIGGFTSVEPALFEVRWLSAEISGMKLATVQTAVGRYPDMITNPFIEGLKIDSPETARLPAGVQHLRGQVMVTLLNQSLQDRQASFTLSVDKQVTIFPAGTDPSKLFDKDPATAHAMLNATWRIAVSPTDPGTTGNYGLNMRLDDAPAGIAHRAYIRTPDAKEIAAGWVAIPNGRGSIVNSRSFFGDLGKSRTVDVILRPDPALLRRFVTDEPIWGEEMIFRDVKVGATPPFPSTGVQKPSILSAPAK